MDRYVIIGNPVAHSRSPEIHARFAAATGEAIAYERLLVTPGDFARATGEFFAAGGCGANVTLPFKVDAYAFANERTPRAGEAGAVNTLAQRGAAILGDNTDGAGLVRDLCVNLGLELAGRRILLVGAGGAARGVVAPLLALAPTVLVIANRTADRATELAQRFRHSGPVKGAGLDAMGEGYDLVVNATSSSTRGETLVLPGGLFAPGATAYDMAYGDPARPFLERARAAGARACDGLGMLVEQAAESFVLWRGKRPETASVIAALRAA
ncbi:MAG TPA: shikimate dehydrogenase [Usitatibacteraceae bacterium]|nr:shikimate dehydrogenase [Usitatibacteraceae bacterium]